MIITIKFWQKNCLDFVVCFYNYHNYLWIFIQIAVGNFFSKIECDVLITVVTTVVFIIYEIKKQKSIYMSLLLVLNTLRMLY